MNSSGNWTFNLFTQNFGYDRWGNRTVSCSPCQPGVTGDVFTIDAATNRITAKNGTGMTYDSAGNQTYDATGNRWFDGENRMHKATQGGTTSHYVYDADGKRVRRIIGSTETWMIYGVDGELVGEYAAAASASSPQKEYGYRSGQLLIAAETSPLKITWMVTDHLGTPRMNIRGTGTDGGSLASVTRHDYLPFGEDLIAGIRLNGGSGQYGYEPPPDGVRQKFTGYERDIETDLDFAQARLYSNKQGRFTSPDPFLASARLFLPQSWNRYSYALNRPLNYTDSTGLDPQEDEVRRLRQETERLKQETARLQEEAQRIQGELNGFPLTYQDPVLLDSVGSVTTDFAVIGALGANELSENGLQFIAQWEAFVATPYNDAANNATIGYGHLMHYGPVTEADTQQYPNGISQNQAMGLLRQDAAVAEAAVRDNVAVALNQHQFDALTSFTFNVGVGAFRNSTLLREVNAGNFDAVPGQMGRWVNAGGRRLRGLENRRAAEGALFTRQGR